MRPEEKEAYFAHRKALTKHNKEKTIGCIWLGFVLWFLSLIAVFVLSYILSLQIPNRLAQYLELLQSMLIIDGLFGIPIIQFFAVFLYKMKKLLHGKDKTH